MKTIEIAEKISSVAKVISSFYINKELVIIKDKVVVPFRTTVISVQVKPSYIDPFVQKFISSYETDFYAKANNTCVEVKYDYFAKTLSLRMCSVFANDSENIERFETLRGTKRIVL